MIFPVAVAILFSIADPPEVGQARFGLTNIVFAAGAPEVVQ